MSSPLYEAVRLWGVPDRAQPTIEIKSARRTPRDEDLDRIQELRALSNPTEEEFNEILTQRNGGAYIAACLDKKVSTVNSARNRGKAMRYYSAYLEAKQTEV